MATLGACAGILAMRRVQSDPSLIVTRKSTFRDHIGNAIPGYLGHVPGSRTGPAHIQSAPFAHAVRGCREARSQQAWHTQEHRLGQEAEDHRVRSIVPPSMAPMYDKRGISHPFAGDTVHSRIAPTNEEKVHFQSSYGLTSSAHEGLGGLGTMQGYGSASRGIPGFMGHIPGKISENVFAEGQSKSHEKSIRSHFKARSQAPKKWNVMTEGCTLVAPTSSDTLTEKPVFNPAYNDCQNGWSTCEFTGTKVGPAGRLAPHGRQEGFGAQSVPLMGHMHGYAGWAPCRVGENVIGERHAKTDFLADHLNKKNRMRHTQR